MKLIRIVPLLAILAALLLLVAGPGTRLDLWEFRFGFQLMRWALYLAGAAGILALLLLLIPRTRRGHGLALSIALVISLSVAAVPLLQYRTVQSVPRIHDITTDTINPPEFIAVAPLRADAPNPIEYQGEEIARQQRAAYPDITTFETDAYPAIVFERALEVVERLGWELVEANPDQGRIEATDTTFWFGFKDDVVIRIQATDSGTRVDVRSKSRVGLSDVGANANRIRRFLDALDEGVH
jgi:uncharacterized protein (DUF1499 family)